MNKIFLSLLLFVFISINTNSQSNPTKEQLQALYKQLDKKYGKTDGDVRWVDAYAAIYETDAGDEETAKQWHRIDADVKKILGMGEVSTDIFVEYVSSHKNFDQLQTVAMKRNDYNITTVVSPPKPEEVEYMRRKDNVIGIMVVITLLLIVIGYIAICMIPVSMAKKRGRSQFGWFLFSFFLLPLFGMIFLAFLGETDDKRKQRIMEEEELKQLINHKHIHNQEPTAEKRNFNPSAKTVNDMYKR